MIAGPTKRTTTRNGPIEIPVISRNSNVPRRLPRFSEPRLNRLSPAKKGSAQNLVDDIYRTLKKGPDKAKGMKGSVHKTRRRGNPSYDADVVDEAGRKFVGKGYSKAPGEDGGYRLLSKDGTRMYRRPTVKSNSFTNTGVEGNFMSRPHRQTGYDFNYHVDVGGL